MGLYSGRASRIAVDFALCSRAQARAFSPCTSSSHWNGSSLLWAAAGWGTVATTSVADIIHLARELFIRLTSEVRNDRRSRTGFFRGTVAVGNALISEMGTAGVS